MNYFIKNIHINNLYHLHDFDIPIADESTPHLMLTGKNGSGKTVLLNAIASFLDRVKRDSDMNFNNYRKWYERDFQQYDRLKDSNDEAALMQLKSKIEYYKKEIDSIFGKIEPEFVNLPALISDYQKGDFIIAFYEAARKPQMIEPQNPTKPTYNVKGDAKQTATSQFLNFMSDLKIQEALARNEKEMDDADRIKEWFVDFENLLKQIYQNEELQLKPVGGINLS